MQHSKYVRALKLRQGLRLEHSCLRSSYSIHCRLENLERVGRPEALTDQELHNDQRPLATMELISESRIDKVKFGSTGGIITKIIEKLILKKCQRTR